MDRSERLALKLREYNGRRALPAFLANITQNTDLTKDDLRFFDLSQSDKWRQRFWDLYRTHRDQGTLTAVSSTQNPDEVHEAAMRLSPLARSSQLVVLFHEDTLGAATIDRSLFFRNALALLSVDTNYVCIAEDDFSGGALFDVDCTRTADSAAHAGPSIITYSIESWGTWATPHRTA